jgi:hypothetical protein
MGVEVMENCEREINVALSRFIIAICQSKTSGPSMELWLAGVELVASSY